MFCDRQKFFLRIDPRPFPPDGLAVVASRSRTNFWNATLQITGVSEKARSGDLGYVEYANWR